jgi:hypothetical protein
MEAVRYLRDMAMVIENKNYANPHPTIIKYILNE